MSTNAVARSWRVALADGIVASRNAGAAHNSGEVILRKKVPGLGQLHLGASQKLSKQMPGNGGLRLWQYDSSEDASSEAARLGKGMELKHSTFGTGFAGAKVVCEAEKPVASWTGEDKKVLLDAVANMLDEQNGAMYTGCDMNTTTDDMAYLDSQSPYVLAAIANPACCPNTATGYGVFGAVQAILGGSVAGKSLLVHGCGGVGSVVARLLVEHGAASVKTYDVLAERADIAGCTNVSASEAWWSNEVDCLVPCSASGLLTEETPLAAANVVGATNLPFRDPATQAAAEARLTFVPEGVSSAGAVIVDSVEHYARDYFAAATPAELYEFTRQTVRTKTGELLQLSSRLGVPPSLVLPLAAAPTDAEPIGTQFAAWAEARKAAALSAAIRSGAHLSPADGADALSQASADALNQARQLLGSMSKPPRQAQGARQASTLAGGGRARTMSSAAGAGSADVIIVGAGIMGLNIAYQVGLDSRVEARARVRVRVRVRVGVS